MKRKKATAPKRKLSHPDVFITSSAPLSDHRRLTQLEAQIKHSEGANERLQLIIDRLLNALIGR
jgi:hypothetical protein